MIELTKLEWQIVDQQCLECKLWSEDTGCTYEFACCERPVDSCLIYKENKLLCRR